MNLYHHGEPNGSSRRCSRAEDGLFPLLNHMVMMVADSLWAILLLKLCCNPFTHDDVGKSRSMTVNNYSERPRSKAIVTSCSTRRDRKSDHWDGFVHALHSDPICHVEISICQLLGCRLANKSSSRCDHFESPQVLGCVGEA